MVTKCVVPNCGNSCNAKLSVALFSFPKNPTLAKLWQNATRARATTKDGIKSHHKVCSDHFEERFVLKQFGATRLKPGAVPTLFEWNSKTQKTAGYIVSKYQQNESPLLVNLLKDEPLDCDVILPDTSACLLYKGESLATGNGFHHYDSEDCVPFSAESDLLSHTAGEKSTIEDRIVGEIIIDACNTSEGDNSSNTSKPSLMLSSVSLRSSTLAPTRKDRSEESRTIFAEQEPLRICDELRHPHGGKKRMLVGEVINGEGNPNRSKFTAVEPRDECDELSRKLKAYKLALRRKCKIIDRLKNDKGRLSRKINILNKALGKLRKTSIFAESSIQLLREALAPKSLLLHENPKMAELYDLVLVLRSLSKQVYNFIKTERTAGTKITEKEPVDEAFLMDLIIPCQLTSISSDFVAVTLSRRAKLSPQPISSPYSQRLFSPSV